MRPFYEKRMGQEVEADTLGDEFKVIKPNFNNSGFLFVQKTLCSIQSCPHSDKFQGYVLRITGGNDKQGFPMKQGILTNGRVVVQNRRKPRKLRN